MIEFDESKHPRDESGKFTNKGAFRQNTGYGEILASSQVQREYVEQIGTKYNLNSDEVNAVHRYVNSFQDGWYRKINEVLRKGEPLSEEDERICQHLDKALEKLPKYQGNLLRTIQVDDKELEDFLKSYRMGDKITYEAYTSTTTLNKPQMFGNINFLINNAKKGADLREFNPKQQEVLYKRKSIFIVNKVQKKADKYFILLKEG